MRWTSDGRGLTYGVEGSYLQEVWVLKREEGSHLREVRVVEEK